MMAKGKPEFSRVLDIGSLGDVAKRMHLEADEAERSALAHRFDLKTVEALTADFVVTRIAGGELICVKGRVAAKIVQSCVITGEPVAASIDEAVDERFGPPAEVPEEIDLSLDEAEPPVPLEDNMIDLGEIAAQYLAIAIDPYLKAPDAEIPQEYSDEADDGAESRKNPFEALAALKKNGE